MLLSRVVFLTYRNRTVVLSKLEPRQMVILLLAGPVILLGASGWTERLVFTSPSLAKYLVTVAVPLVAAAVALAPSPFLVFVAAAVFLAPAATLQVSFMGVSFEALVVLCLLAGVPLLLGLTRPIGKSGLGRVLPLALVLAAIPLARGTQIWTTVSVAVTAATVIFLCARAVQLRGGTTVVLCSGAASLLAQASLGIWEYLTRSEFDIYTGTVRSTANYFFDFQSQPRPTGTFSDPISLGTSLMAAVPIGLAVIYLLVERKKWIAAVATTLLTGVIGLGLALTLSRMATLGALASLVAIVIFVPRFARARVAQISGFLIAVMFVGAYAFGGASLLERASSISDPTAAGVATADGDRDREFLWHVAGETGLANPIAGVGIGNLNRIFVAKAAHSGVFTHAHSAYLQIFAEAGILGLAALVLLLGGLVRDIRKARLRSPVLTAGLAGAVVALAIAATTDVVTIRYEAVAATIAPVFGLIVGLAGQARHG